MFAFIFAILLTAFVIISLKKRSFLFYFFPLFLFLPDYYGLELSIDLPIITASRVILLVFYLYVIIHYKPYKDFLKQLKLSNFRFFIPYFAFRTVANVYYITTYNQAIKTLFSILFEGLILVIIACTISVSREELLKTIRFFSYGLFIMTLLGIIESLIGLRLPDLLYTVTRDLPNDHYIRLGLLRATVSMGLPNFFGNLCVLAMPIHIFCYYVNKEKKFLFFIAADILACVHSGTRSSILFIMAVVFIVFIQKLIRKNSVISFLKNCLLITAALALFFVITSLTSARLKNYYSGTVKSVLNEVGFDFDLNTSTSEEASSGYGRNVDGTTSRLGQLSGIKYAFSVNPIFGLGSGAQKRGDIRYFVRGKWRVSRTYDVGPVEVFMDEGILGSIAYISLFITLFYLCFKKRTLLNSYLTLSLVAYLLCMLSSANLPSFLYTIAFFVILSYRTEESATQ